MAGVSYTCEICGLEGFTDDQMRRHTLAYHVDGEATCPFCDLTDLTDDEMLLHVNQAHLDFLTPEAELAPFLDDHSPTYDEDSDTISERNSFDHLRNGWHTPTANATAANAATTTTTNTNGHGRHNHNHHHHGSRSSSQNSLDSSEGARRKTKQSTSTSSSNRAKTNGTSEHKRSESSFSFVAKGKSGKGKSSSRQSSVESVTHNGNGRHGHSGNNSGSDYELSPANSKASLSGAGQGSPLRSQLALKLKSNTPKKMKPPTPSPPIVQCLMCEYTSDSPQRLEEHMNRAHFDLTSPSLTNNHNNDSTNATNPTLAFTAATQSSLCCPLCEKTFTSGTELELHVNIQHRDILSPQKDGASGVNNTVHLQAAENMLMESSPSPGALVCPVCCQTLPNCTTQQDMTKHIEEHFERGGDESNRRLINDQQREVQRHREQREFEMLRAQYGMDEQGNYGQQAARGLRRAVYTGELSVRDYYERRIGLKRAESDGVDDSTSCTKGILPKIRALNAQNPSIAKTYLCSAVDHYASTYGDRGWGCGFRNMQMLISSLVEHPAYSEVVYRGAWKVGSNYNRGPPPSPPRSAVPSISRLQMMIEHAWKLGFDVQGAEQLGSKLHNTRKWIGAYEVVTVLSSLRIRCQLVDFHKPTASDGGHPALFAWVLKYFQENPEDFKPPLYLQHQGHSRTIIGCEILHKTTGVSSGSNSLRLLVLDPSHGATQLEAGALRSLKRAPPALRARQYQLVAIRGLMEDDQEYEESKVLRSIKIPQER